MGSEMCIRDRLETGQYDPEVGAAPSTISLFPSAKAFEKKKILIIIKKNFIY